MISICIFSGTSSTDNENGIENKLKNCSLALKSKNLESNWNFKSEIASAYFSVEVTLYFDKHGKWVVFVFLAGFPTAEVYFQKILCGRINYVLIDFDVASVNSTHLSAM